MLESPAAIQPLPNLKLAARIDLAQIITTFSRELHVQVINAQIINAQIINVLQINFHGDFYCFLLGFAFYIRRLLRFEGRI